MTALLIVTPDLSDNSTGRAYVWWLLARNAGWDADVVSFHGDAVWGPLRDGDFATCCTILTEKTATGRARRIASLAADHDVVVAVKPLPASLGISLAARRRRRFPLIIDVDDPDLEARVARRRFTMRVLWRARHLRFWLRVRRFDMLATRASVTVSNPVLQSIYGGILLPHARPDPGVGARHESSRPRIAFVGTARHHKGIDVLREAVARLAPSGVELVVTAEAPSDAKAWERWVGEGSIETGEQILSEADIVALPSLPSSFAYGQLPAKLVDAMIGGRVVVVSDIEPMPWAVGDPSLCIRPGSVDDLVGALSRLRDPQLRQRHAIELRRRALAEFSIEAMTPRFLDAVEQARAKSRPPHTGPM